MQRVCGRNIHVFRTSLMLTQEELAEKAGVSQQAISKIERGISAVSLETACKIAKALGISVAQIYTLNLDV